METLPIRKIPSIGGMTETTLKELGIETGSDIVDRAADIMIAYSTYPKTHEFLIKRGLGIARDQHHEEEVE